MAQTRMCSSGWCSCARRNASSAPPIAYSDHRARSCCTGSVCWSNSERSCVRAVVEIAAARGSLGQLLARLPHEPFVGVKVQLDQVADCQLRQIADRWRLRLAVGDLENAAGGAMDAGAFVAFAGVAPVEDEDAAVGAVAQVDAAEPGVAEEQAVVAVFADVAGAAALEDFLICAAAVVVEREQLAAIRGGPVVAQVDHRAACGRGRRHRCSLCRRATWSSLGRCRSASGRRACRSADRRTGWRRRCARRRSARRG